MLNTAICHCGAVELQLAHQPQKVFECSCSICLKLGVLWAYYPCDDVVFKKGMNMTNIYMWNQRILEFHSCSSCGCTTHWIAADKTYREKMGVNARLIDGLNRSNVIIEHITNGDAGQHWTSQ